MVPQPEQEARKAIDRLLEQAGWVVRDVTQANIHAARGVQTRDFSSPGYGFSESEESDCRRHRQQGGAVVMFMRAVKTSEKCIFARTRSGARVPTISFRERSNAA